MRIDYLEIKSRWKNLQGLVVNFDEREPVTALIGRNGAAKSNLLEAIIYIFRNIDLNEPAEFSYEIKYSIADKAVVLEAQQGKCPKATVAGVSTHLDEIRDHLTPHYVVGYYSGSSDRFQKLFEKHDLQARDAGKEEGKTPGNAKTLRLRRYTYARPEHGLFALLAFYFSGDEKVKDFLREILRIEGFDSTLITVRRPTWGNDDIEQFWGATGAVNDLLKCLQANSLAPFHRVLRQKKDFASHGGKVELWHLFLPDLAALQTVAAKYNNDPNVLFQALDSMRLSKLLEDFRVRVKVKGAGGVIHTRQMSEGEQQLLTVLGLMRFTRRKNSLYLLDEPDTHLNPAWEVNYLHMLRQVAEIETKSHTILATHDPLLVAGLRKGQIRVLTRGDDGKISANEPEVSPRGRGVAAVLTSPLYGLESQLDEFSLRVLQRIYEVSFARRSAKRTRHLQRLRRLVPGVEPDESSPDPYRNIARLAFRLARQFPLDAEYAHGRKQEIIKALSNQLLTDVSKKG